MWSTCSDWKEDWQVTKTKAELHSVNLNVD